jgi:hypothetical protein
VHFLGAEPPQQVGGPFGHDPVSDMHGHQEVTLGPDRIIVAVLMLRLPPGQTAPAGRLETGVVV